MQDSEKSIKIDDVVNQSIEESDQSSSICMQKFNAATNSNESNKHSFGPYEEKKGESLKMDTSDNQTTINNLEVTLKMLHSIRMTTEINNLS